MLAADLLARLEERGYAVTFERGRLMIRGPADPRPELEQAIVANRDALAARSSSPPAWLATELDLYASGHETMVRRIDPEKGGSKRYPERVSVENVVAAVGAELGLSISEWEKIKPEVEEAASRWKGDAAREDSQANQARTLQEAHSPPGAGHGAHRPRHGQAPLLLS